MGALTPDISIFTIQGYILLLGNVLVEILGHAEAIHLLVPEDLGHFLIWGEQQTVVRILQLVFLDIGPEPGNTLGT